jgi:hypothetical protein
VTDIADAVAATGLLDAELAVKVVDLLDTWGFLAVPTPDDQPVLAATKWRNNAYMIQDLRRLGYLTDDMHVLDCTYGRGKWWTLGEPPSFVKHDLLTVDGVDFCNLPEPADTFDFTAFDPPYAAQGGKETSTLQDYNNAYGRDTAAGDPNGIQLDIDRGLSETYRVTKPNGIVIVKVQDYVWSGKLWPGTHLTLTKAFELGFKLEDRFEHIGNIRPQPPRTRKCGTCDGQGQMPGSILPCTVCPGDGRIPSQQQHAAHNHSTLFVLRVPKRKHRQESLL